MGVVATHAALFLIGFRSGPRYPRVLVAERDALMHEIADCLHARPAGIGLTEMGPRQIEQPIAVAVPARNKEDESFLRKKLAPELAQRPSVI